MDNYEAYEKALKLIEEIRAGSSSRASKIDEVAICFRAERSLIDWVDEATANGLDHFNSVPYDTMRRQDIAGESFGVRFEFLRWEGYPWRIEAMCVMDGWAPLHDAAMNQDGSPVVIHVSYKVDNLVDYQEEVRILRDSGLAMKGEYMNSYGIFSYWPGPNGSFPYVKPRVNLRDEQ